MAQIAGGEMTMKIQLQSLSGENLSEIAANLTDENDGTFDLKTEKGIGEACRYAVDFYNSAGFELQYSDIKRVLKQRVGALKELELI